MGRGIFFGVLWGVIFSTLFLAGMSLMIPPPGAPFSGPPPKARPLPAESVEPKAEAPVEEKTVAEPQPEAAPEVAPEAAVQTETATGVAPDAAAQPEPESAAAPAPETASEPAPETAAGAAAEVAGAAEPEAAAEAEDAAEVASQTAPAAAPTPDTLKATQPESAPAAVADSEAKKPAASDADRVASAAGDVTQPVGAESSVKPAEAPSVGEVADAPTAAATGQPESAGTVEAAPAKAASAEAAEQPAPDAADSAPPTGEVNEDAIKTAQPPQPGFGDIAGVRVNQLPTIDDGAEVPAAEAADGGRALPGVRVNRLPSIGVEESAAEAAATEDAPEGTAFERNAAAFENPEGKPLLGIVLIDSGAEAGGLDAAALAELPFTVTVAIDPLRPDATEAAETYRAAGFEVAMLATGIPAGAAPKDVEVTFQNNLAVLPQAMAVIDLPEAVFQNDRRLSQQVVAILQAAGLGLITYDKGLNAADQLAAAAALPHAEVVRVLDEAGEDDITIRRSLDRAAFDAAVSGSAVLVAHSYPTTVASITAWALGSGGSVALAPVSAVVRSAQPEG